MVKKLDSIVHIHASFSNLCCWLMATSVYFCVSASTIHYREKFKRSTSARALAQLARKTVQLIQSYLHFRRGYLMYSRVWHIALVYYVPKR